MFLSRSCPGCAVGWPSRRRQVLCGHCAAGAQTVGAINGLAGLSACGALFHYDGAVQRAVVTAKSGARPDVFRAAARELAELATELGGSAGPPSLVTWIPASRRGRGERGFDQGRIMAGVLSRQLGVPARRVLAGGRSSQLGRGRAARLAADEFRARGPVAGSVLLVDDVITTGASMVSGAAALRAAGASSVVGLAIAWAALPEELTLGRPLPRGRRSGPFAPA